MENAALKIKGRMKLPCEISKLLKVCANFVLVMPYKVSKSQKSEHEDICLISVNCTTFELLLANIV